MSRRRKLFKFNLKRESLISVMAVILVLLSILSFISFFAQAASASPLFQDVLNRFFGWGSIIVPFILAVAGFWLLGRNLRFARLNTLLGLLLLLVAFSGLAHLIFL